MRHRLVQALVAVAAVVALAVPLGAQQPDTSSKDACAKAPQAQRTPKPPRIERHKGDPSRENRKKDSVKRPKPDRRKQQKPPRPNCP